MQIDEKALKDTQKLSYAITSQIREYQKSVAQPGRDNTLVILDALAFNTAVLIGRLPRNDYRQARDYFMSRFEEAVAGLR